MKLNWVHKGNGREETVCYARVEYFVFYVLETPDGQFRLEIICTDEGNFALRVWKDIPVTTPRWAQMRAGYCLKKILRGEPGW